MAITLSSFVQGLDRKLEAPVREHLKLVYGTLGMALMAATAGAILHVYGIFTAGLLSMLGSIGFGIALLWVPHNDGKNNTRRLGYLMGFSVCSGLSLGNLINVAMFFNPTIVPVALLSTSFVFACFTMATFFSDTRQMLYMTGSLISTLTVLMIFSLINIFIRSETLSYMSLLLGLTITCAFICYDTAKIIEKKRIGSNDHIAHAMILFIDFIDLFRIILIVLMNKESNNRQEKRDGDRKKR